MLSSTYLAIILLSFLSGLTSLIGVVLAFFFKGSDKKIAVGIGFSVGIMLILSFFELLPEALAAAPLPSVSVALGFGFLLIFLLDILFPHIRYFEEEGLLHPHLKTAYLVALGLILHDFPEGFAMANSYILTPSLGLLVSVSIAIHNIPEEFAMAVPLVLTGKRKLLVKLALLSALAEPLGAVVGLVGVSIASALNPLLLAFAAGAMIFISFDELLPMAVRRGELLYFITGIGLSALTFFGLTLILH
jgi:ZIP family zinc transporter